MGTLMLLPFLYTAAGYGFNAMMFAHSAELLSVLFAYFIIDKKGVGGRKITLYFAITLYMLSQFWIHYKREEAVILGTFMIRFADRLTWICIH